MAGPTRSVAIELAENSEAITAWRNALPERQGRRLINPQSVVKRWRAATQPQSDPCRPHDKPAARDLKHDAMTAWRRFVSCVEALPVDQGAPLWQEVQARAAEVLGAKFGVKLHITG
jgi:hypothetical protein